MNLNNCNDNNNNHMLETEKFGDEKPSFGIMFDIDGVLLRGKTPIPCATEALKSLMNKDQTEFVVPTVFCTNGFGLREVKATTLSDKLGVAINPDQIVMSQTPLEMFHEFHDKWCLVSGPEHDGGSARVAESLGFQKVITIEQLRKAYPYLDWVDRQRWPDNHVEDDSAFPDIEAVVLLGEPIRWETNLQLIIDVLVTQGKPSRKPNPEGAQLPVLAVNMDLQWMAKSTIPRFGHGAFLVCLENLYKKISGRDLVYTALIGKPSAITYEYSHKLIEEIAHELDVPNLDTIYAIGDNPLTDIYGANVFNRFLTKKKREIEKLRKSCGHVHHADFTHDMESTQDEASRDITCEAHFSSHGDIANVRGLKRCTSFLVCTGVYQPDTVGAVTDVDSQCGGNPEKECQQLDHGHRDLPYCEKLTTPDHVVDDVKAAIDQICDIERWCPKY